jgi:integrase
MEPRQPPPQLACIRKEASLGQTRFHDLRHTCVTLLLDLGAPPHVAREIVGHSAIEVTMTIYAHVFLDEKRKALSRLGEALK